MDSPRITIGDITVTVSHGALHPPKGLEKLLRAAIVQEGFEIIDLSIVLTDHETVTHLNEVHLNRTYVTDVLAFNFGELWRPVEDKEWVFVVVVVIMLKR